MPHLIKNKHVNNKTKIIITVVFVLLISSCAAADTFDRISRYRSIYSLNGDWLFSAEDRSNFSDRDFDDSYWHSIDVPVELESTSPGSPRSVWFRKHFEIPRGSKYSLLRFNSILDEGEIWLNGEKLINPAFQPPLEDRQAGVYSHIWTFDWPEYFQIGHLVKPGENNVIAVRISDDQIRRTRRVAEHEEPTLKGIYGITGDVLMIGYPLTYIQAFERFATTDLNTNGTIKHIFRAAIVNSGIERKNCSIELNIFSASGTKIFNKKTKASVGPNGHIVEFQWENRPKFEIYRADLIIRDAKGIIDSTSLRFHGIHIKADTTGIKINGSDFIIKGIQGLPGLVRAGTKMEANTHKQEWSKYELNRLKNLGVNTIRLETPPVYVVNQALELGIMVVPIVNHEYERLVIALREFPNILYWDIDSGSAYEVAMISTAIASLDTYHRPISYSGPLQVNPEKHNFKSISILGMDYSPDEDCSAGVSNYYSLPVVVNNWGIKSDYESGIIESEPTLRRKWIDCAFAKHIAGIFYNRIWNENGIPGVRPADVLEWKGYTPEVLEYMYRDFALRLLKTNYGKLKAEIKYTGISGAENIKVTARRYESFLYEWDSLAPDQSIVTEVPGDENRLPVLEIKYTTNSGLPSRTVYYPGKAVFTPDRISFSIPDNPLLSGEKNRIRLILVGGKSPASMEVSLESEIGNTIIVPVKRGVSVPAYDMVEVPFDVIPDGNNKLIVLRTVLKYTNSPTPGIKAYLILKVK